MTKRDSAVSWTLTYNSDLNANLAGGKRTGAAYLQRVGLILDIDLAKSLGWNGARFHSSVHAINGIGLSGRYVGNILTVSGLEAEPALRLFNVWIEQDLGDRSSIRVGQLTAGQEFMLSSTASLFLNSTFGWPASFASDLPSGGPAYPLAAPGARLQVSLARSTTARVAIFAGDPAGPGIGDPQRRDLHGFNGFGFKGAPFVIGEIGYTSEGDNPQVMFTLGGWVHFDKFDDQRSGGVWTGKRGEPPPHAGNYAVYGLADIRLWEHGNQSVYGFVRASASPSDRNPIHLYADAGLSMKGPLRSRPDDSLGIAIAIAGISPALGRFSTGQSVVHPMQDEIPGSEVAIEMTYQWRISSRAFVQPDLQFILRPSGSLLGDNVDQATLNRRAVVAGLRTSLTL